MPGGLADAVEFSVRNPERRHMRDSASSDPRPRDHSPALPDEREGYIPAFGRNDNWLQQWTVFRPESACDLRERDGPRNES